MLIKEKFTLELLRPITYSDKGQSGQECTMLTILAPSNRHQEYVIPLTQGLTRALYNMQNISRPDAAQVVAAKEDVGPEGLKALNNADIFVEMLFASDVDMIAYFNVFKRLITNSQLPCVFFNDTNISFGTANYDALSIDDTKNLLGEYLSNFLSPKMMRQ